MNLDLEADCETVASVKVFQRAENEEGGRGRRDINRGINTKIVPFISLVCLYYYGGA